MPGKSGGSSVLNIPATIEDKAVKAIGANAFANGGYGKNYTEVVIPSSVETIGAYAFARSPQLSTVTIEAGSNLKTIGNGAFAETALTTFTIGATVESIGAGVFRECAQLESITVDAGNTVYESVDGLLYNEAVETLIAVPGNKKAGESVETQLTIPATVTEIAPYACTGNTNLTAVNLGNVQTVHAEAFSCCTNLASVTAPEMRFVESGAFSGTSWAETDGDALTLGKVYLRYVGTATSVDLQGYESVSEFAFAGNSTLETVDAGNTLLTIDSYAFMGCEALEEVDFSDANNAVSIGEGIFEMCGDPVVYVSSVNAAGFQQSEGWAAYAENIEVRTTTITFDTLGGNTTESIDVEYADYPELPTPVRTGYEFGGWYDGVQDGAAAGQAIDSTAPWTNKAAAVTLYAAWTPTEYIIYYEPNGGTMETAQTAYTIEDAVTFALPTRVGYTFAGWYTDEALTEPAGESLQRDGRATSICMPRGRLRRIPLRSI